MNLVLLDQADLTAEGRSRLSGRRYDHITGVLGAGEGDEIAVGLLNGRMGTARITRVTGEDLELELHLDREPPPLLPVTLLLALPRPKVLRRVLYSLSVLGVKRIFLMNASRVEKSYWQSPFLEESAIRRQLLLGLEQAKDTMLPEVLLRPRFRPFVEDELPSIAGRSLALVAHPAEGLAGPLRSAGEITLAVGPEGGFVPFEIDLLRSCGFQVLSLGERVLNVETAIPSLLARLF